METPLNSAFQAPQLGCVVIQAIAIFAEALENALREQARVDGEPIALPLSDSTSVERELTPGFHARLVNESVAEMFAKQLGSLLVVESGKAAEKCDHSCSRSARSGDESGKGIGRADRQETGCKVMPLLCEIEGGLQVESVNTPIELIR